MQLTLKDLLGLLPEQAELVSKANLEKLVDFEITHIAQNSSAIGPGGVFCALPGTKTSGLNFVEQAVAHGAVAVLIDQSLSPLPENLAELPALLVLVPSLRHLLGDLAARVYGSPNGMQLFGVTGTNGKTSTVSYLQRLLSSVGTPSGLSASTERLVAGRVTQSTLTTPEVCELHQLLREMHAGGDTAAAIEVSAQALIRQRVDGLIFDVAGFTNLSRDHLDDFGSMDAYLAAKLELFRPARARKAVIFLADDFAREVTRRAEIPLTTIGEGGDWGYHFADGTLRLSRRDAEFTIHWSASELMARNFALAFVMLTVAGFDPTELAEVAAKLDTVVAGRLELVASGEIDGYLDYAHTPEAISAALAALAHYPWVTIIFGASGNRDPGKRAEMAAAAASANYVVVTDQHPRDEDPALIRAELSQVLASLRNPEDFAELPDPELAANDAVLHTPPGGAVLWCGPGHLNYREVAGEKIPFAAGKILRKAVVDA
jgi:UDP-N-acetylmuramoyl-L-alanyl-D-glutamate--2,6-diaminopimelate ligase